MLVTIYETWQFLVLLYFISQDDMDFN